MRFSTRIAVGVYALALVPLSGVAAQGALGTSLPGTPLGNTVEGEPGVVTGTGFLAHQVSFPRVAEARDAKDGELRLLFHDSGVAYPGAEIFLRVFKHERVMELWARSSDDSTFTLVKEYPVCALPGQLGPKQRMGDFQVPEGFYYIDGFNPRSNYHLSLRVSYPNLSDRMRGEAISLGGDIFVHGGCETVGCVPIENENIQEVYWLAAQAMQAGQRVIPIHIFPNRMDEDGMRWLERTFSPDEPLLEFWQNLAEGYTYFQDTQRVPWITVTESGRYTIPTYTRYANDDRDRDVARTRAIGPQPDPLSVPAVAAKASATAQAPATAEAPATAAAEERSEAPAPSERPDTATRTASDVGPAAEEPVEESSERPAEESSEEPAGESESSEEPEPGPVGEPVGEEEAKDPAEKSSEDPAEESSEEPAEESSKEPAEESSKEAARESESSEEPEPGPVGEPVGAEEAEPEAEEEAEEDPEAEEPAEEEAEEEAEEDPEAEEPDEDPDGDPDEEAGAG